MATVCPGRILIEVRAGAFVWEMERYWHDQWQWAAQVLELVGLEC